MKKRIIDLREGGSDPLLDIVSYGRGGRPFTPDQKELIARTVRRVPEVMVKVSGGARTIAGVEQHVAYIGGRGSSLEDDAGEHLGGKGFERQLAEDWNLDLEAHERQTERSIRGRKPPKLVHNIIFSMPLGTPSGKVLEAVRKLALNEWQLKHRYAMALHTDDDHPHVHVVVKAVSEEGQRLNIKKATLRAWRQQFASNLRELGMAANATERAVRGETKTHRSDGAYRATQHAGSTLLRIENSSLSREWSSGRSPGGRARRSSRKLAGTWSTGGAVSAHVLKPMATLNLGNESMRFQGKCRPRNRRSRHLSSAMNARVRTR